jgi:hypothetical protein
LQAAIFTTPRRWSFGAFSLLILGAATATAWDYSADTMSSKLVPANPSDVMVIRNITPNIVTLSVPFLRFGKLPIGGRGTIVKLTSGGLIVFSPVALTTEVKAKVEELGGNVKYLVAPDIEHHIFLSDWATAYPGVKLIGPEGLPEKRQKDNDPKIGKEPFEVVFTAKNKREVKISPEVDQDFDYEYVDAHQNKELVFFYKPDKVVIQADLLFNLPANEQYSRVPEAQRPKPGLLGSVLFPLWTTEGEAKGAKRFMWYVMSRGNRPSWDESIRRINSWDFDTLIPCHGDVLEGNGKQAFQKIFEWHINGKH